MAKKNKNRKKLNDKHKKQKGIFSIPLFIFLLLASFMIIAYNVYNHEYFKISQVFIDGNKMLTDELIIKTADNPVGKNIFTYNEKDYEEQLLDLEGIKEAKIIKELPDRVKIEVSEIYPFLKVNAKNKTYVISNTGEIMNKKSGIDILPTYKGELSSVTDGEFFTDNPLILELIRKIQKFSYSNLITEFNLENDRDIGIIIKGIQIKFGDLKNTDYKLNLLDSVLKDIDQKGLSALKIDLTKGDSPIVELEEDSLNQEDYNE